MTTTPSEARPFHPADLGTLVIMPWTGKVGDGNDMPYLLVCSRGDAPDGPDAASAAVERLLNDIGLSLGEDLIDGAARPGLPVSLLVVAGQAVVTMPRLTSQCAVPPAWLTAAAKRGCAYFLFATRPWPDPRVGRTVTADALREFVTAEETVQTSTHLLLPARSLRR
ncbi:DUF5949 family protein [Streptomyces chromofuscus]|uniref:Uncharacterized protein n=1 Tax=Streptomyces chromofuscus TaxID=42881 RepID=A0A7M2TFL8_STRCW|nr:DUF5949 family protein [Streptomyces chromofuscus]QOV46743.1 hypothetical protein IPT68_13155 [Streptomyces chromofuscus]GGT40783.1 hypothetical protein GCM10010254_70860 [Streptomyces chromofuscus]